MWIIIKYKTKEMDAVVPVNLTSARMPPKVIRQTDTQSPSIPSMRFKALITPTTQNMVTAVSNPPKER